MRRGKPAQDRRDEIADIGGALYLFRARPRDDAEGLQGRSDALLEDLQAIDATLAMLVVDATAWEVLYRMRLQVERDMLLGVPVGHAFATDRATLPPTVGRGQA